MEFLEAAGKAVEAIGVLYLFDGTGRIDIGTAVLVVVGGREFLFTAGHNLEDCRSRDDIRLFFPGYEPIVQATCNGGTGITDYGFTREPDVGFIELDPDYRTLWARRKPIPLDRLIRREDVDTSDYLVLVGIPSADAKVEHDFPRKDRLDVATSITAKCIGATLVDARSPSEPPHGRGLHVKYHGDFVDSITGKPVKLSAPEGISGGPLCAVSAAGVRLLGLARSVHGEARCEWCEPAYEVARLLVDHRDATVSSAAELLLRRLGV